MKPPVPASLAFAGVCALLLIAGPLPVAYIVTAILLLSLLVACMEHGR
jgi:hypothetical protein